MKKILFLTLLTSLMAQKHFDGLYMPPNPMTFGLYLVLNSDHSGKEIFFTCLQRDTTDISWDINQDTLITKNANSKFVLKQPEVTEIIDPTIDGIKIEMSFKDIFQFPGGICVNDTIIHADDDGIVYLQNWNTDEHIYIFSLFDNEFEIIKYLEKSNYIKIVFNDTKRYWKINDKYLIKNDKIYFIDDGKTSKNYLQKVQSIKN